jgi:hypothetical protein
MIRVLYFVLPLILLAGCLPESRVVWSPDGQYALIRHPHGLCLSDGEGTLSPDIATDVTAVAWMPDSRSFVAACATTCKTWKELAPHLPAAVKDGIWQAAGKMRNQILEYEGSWDKFEFKPELVDFLAALMCLRDQYGKELAPKVGKRWEELADVQHRVFALQLFDVADGKVKPGKVLLETLTPPAEMRISPDGKALAYAAAPCPPVNYGPTFSLYVFPLEDAMQPAASSLGKNPRVDGGVSPFFDWTPDSRSLVYAAFSGVDPDYVLSPKIGFSCEEKGLVYARDYLRELGRQPPDRRGGIWRTQVVKDGRLVTKMEPEKLAGVLFYDSLPVKCLKDGRLLFATHGESYPSLAGNDEPSNISLFVLGPKSIEPLFSAALMSPMGGTFDAFQVSPDESKVVVSTRDGLSVLDLKGGKVTVEESVDVQDRFGGVIPVTLPVWRSAKELCFVVDKGSKLGSPDAPEVVLWSMAGPRVLSKHWPEAVREGWLDRPKPESK